MTNKEWLASLSSKMQEDFFGNGFYVRYKSDLEKDTSITHLLNARHLFSGKCYGSVEKFLSWFDEEQMYMLPTTTLNQLLEVLDFGKIPFVNFIDEEDGLAGELPTKEFLKQYGEYFLMLWRNYGGGIQVWMRSNSNDK